MLTAGGSPHMPHYLQNTRRPVSSILSGRNSDGILNFGYDWSMDDPLHLISRQQENLSSVSTLRLQDHETISLPVLSVQGSAHWDQRSICSKAGPR